MFLVAGLNDSNEDVCMWTLISLKALLEDMDKRVTAARAARKTVCALRWCAVDSLHVLTPSVVIVSLLPVYV